MNPQAFDNFMASIENMDDAQTSKVLQAVLKKKQIIPVLCFVKKDYDDVMVENNCEPMAEEEWNELEESVMEAKKSKDMAYSEMLRPMSSWLGTLMTEIKRKHSDFRIGTRVMTSTNDSMEDIRMSRSTDELAYMVCPPNTKRVTSWKWLHMMSKKPKESINYWLQPPMK
jgi:hypothetical protein